MLTWFWWHLTFGDLWLLVNLTLVTFINPRFGWDQDWNWSWAVTIFTTKNLISDCVSLKSQFPTNSGSDPEIFRVRIPVPNSNKLNILKTFDKICHFSKFANFQAFPLIYPQNSIICGGYKVPGAINSFWFMVGTYHPPLWGVFKFHWSSNNWKPV